ncbi:MAG: hypothetical protein Q7S58_19655 [Candidatus Binatus sp.]|nr:hypothetical protein [Candidatus Binatus sp.]
MAQRKLRLTISSPTLAQGIDLSCSVLLFRSIYRAGKPIPPHEYANVVGRAGRAFVDLDGITVYPVFQAGYEGDKRVEAFRKLRRNAQVREMESGIVLLIQHLVTLLAEFTGATYDDIVSYVANTSGPWTLEGFTGNRVESESGIDPDLAFFEAISELDTMIFGTIEDAQLAQDEVANALDLALQTSLWKRRLSRMTDDDAALQTAILHGRAEWLWRNTTASERLGFYAAGIGYRTGSALIAQLNALSEHLARAETMLAEGAVNAASEELSSFAQAVFRIPPFAPESLPEGWPDLLGKWIAGDSLVATIGTSEGVEFIQNAVVYQLVWAVEAVRVQALAAGDQRMAEAIGRIPLSLTYGLPTLTAAALAQAGLHSRRMIIAALNAVPADFTDVDGMLTWLQDGAGETIASLWTNRGDVQLWERFVKSGDYEEDTGSQARTLTDVQWSGSAPVGGSAVRLLHNPRTNTTSVYAPDLTKLGALATAYPDIGFSDVVGTISDDGLAIQVSGWEF